ncbi:MAG: electron transfer flavoprotein subunit beta/FixA family protein [Candidatus Latescibacterota bacterium]|nr:MAG: electron transfer flavoprotein subunit beta/FixA family protein [Candidatus Latescibacterota bacterium]
MNYHSVVCVKQVPDTNRITGNPMKDDGTVNRAALEAIANPDDMHALEAALEIRDHHGGSVSVITMGPPRAAEVLREALYRGADDGYLISDERAAGSDTLATSYVLACAVKKLSPDMVFCGRRTIDGDNAQVGPQLAEKTELTLITYVDSLVAVEDRTVTARRDLDTGWELVAAELPVLMTVAHTANTPRPPSVKRMMKLKKARSRPEIVEKLMRDADWPDKTSLKTAVDRRAAELEKHGLLIQSWTLDDIGAKPGRCGLRGSPTKIHRVQSIVFTAAEQKRFRNDEAGVSELIGLLIKDHTIR